jgi:Trypsin-co-occurring domain 1
MAEERTLTVDPGDGMTIAVVAERVGGALVSDEDVVAQLGAVAGSVEAVSRAFLEAVKRIGPKRGEVELTFGLAIEAGQLVALFGKAKGEASIRVVLGWGEG